jgi:hypothetical protein
MLSLDASNKARPKKDYRYAGGDQGEAHERQHQWHRSLVGGLLDVDDREIRLQLSQSHEIVDELGNSMIRTIG